MNKRIVSLVLSLLLLIACAACTKQASPDTDAPTVEQLKDAEGASAALAVPDGGGKTWEVTGILHG